MGQTTDRGAIVAAIIGGVFLIVATIIGALLSRANSAPVLTPAPTAQVGATLLPATAVTDQVVAIATIEPSPTSFATAEPVVVVVNTTQVVSTETPAALGTLVVRAEGCGNSSQDVWIRSKNASDRIGSINQPVSVTAGTYTVSVSWFGKNLEKDDVVVKDQMTTTVDISDSVGNIRVEGYPEIGAPPFTIIAVGGPNAAENPLLSDNDICSPIGDHVVKLVSSFCYANNPFGGCQIHGFGFFTETVALLTKVNSGETTTIQPKQWPQQFGVLTIVPNTYLSKLEVTDIANGNSATYEILNYGDNLWAKPGKYKITPIGEAFSGKSYDVEIKPGERTVLLWAT